jgi:hypothetical protein
MSQTNALLAGIAVRENVSPGIPVDLVSRPTDLYNLLLQNGLVVPSNGAQPFEWNVQYSSTDNAEIFVENQAIGSTNRRNLARAVLSPFYLRAVASVTGHVLDQVARGGTFEDLLQAEIANATKDLYSLLESTLLGSTQDRGIASIVDSGDTYAGLAPGSYSTWAAYEQGIGGALSAAVMHDTYEALTTVPYNATPSVILCAANQITNYVSIMGASSSYSRMNLPLSGPVDLGLLRSAPTYNGIPLINIRRMTTTEMYWLDLSSGVQLVMHRDLKVENLAKVNDNQEVVASMACALKVANRRKHGKLTGITA